jgi:hypothetical protein
MRPQVHTSPEMYENVPRRLRISPRYGYFAWTLMYPASVDERAVCASLTKIDML